MLRGMSRPFKNIKGMTLMEVLLSIFLISVVFLGSTALFVASQRFNFTANDKVILSYELQYAVQHIYKNAMRAMGDRALPPFDVSVAERLDININENDPLTELNYSSGMVTYSYRRNGDMLEFSDDNGTTWESIAPKVAVTGVGFSLDGNVLTFSLEASYGNEELIFYSACYPRLASSFQ